MRPVPIVQEGEWTQGAGWKGKENLAPTWIRFPDSSARSESLSGKEGTHIDAVMLNCTYSISVESSMQWYWMQSNRRILVYIAYL